MYSVVGSFLNLQLLSEMAVSRSFDSGISVIEQRSLVNYLKLELREDVNEYVKNYMYLIGINNTLDTIVKNYLAGRKIIEAGRSFQLKGKITRNTFVEFQEKLASLEQKQEYRLVYSMFNQIVKNLIDDNPIFIELNQLDIQNSGHNPLKELIVNNSKKNITFNYIVSGTANNATHFFLLEQQGNDVLVKDSVGSEDRADFFNIFLKFDVDVGIRFHKVFDKLQYSSGVCEIYPVIQMLFDIRLRLFNKPYRYSILNSIIEQDKKTRLLEIFTDGLTEAPFGTFEGFVKENQPTNSQSNRMLSLGHGGAIYDARYTLLETQKNRAKATSKELYSVGKEFKKIFAIQPTTQNPELDAYLNISLRLLSFLRKNKFLVKQQKVNLISDLMATSLNIPQNRLKSVISIMLDEIDNLVISSEDLVSKIETYYRQSISIQKGELESVVKLYISQGFADRLAKSILDAGMVDFSNPRTYIRAGYAYWKTLEYAEMFDRRVTKWILSRNDEELSAERKKVMLSAIYPNSDSFLTIGEIYIYEHINDYYNGDDYKKVAQLLVDSGISYTKNTEYNISNIFAEIVASRDSLENLPHFIAWNRNFREDIFRYVATANDEKFNQKITPFFFETKEVDKDYVRVVAGKYTFSMINEKDNTTDYSQIGKDFAHMLIIAEGNDRNDTFNTAIEKGKVLLHSNYHFRTGVFNWVLNNPYVKNDIGMSSIPVFRYISNKDNEQKMFTKRLGIQTSLSSLSTINSNNIKQLTEDIIFVFDTLSSSESFSHREGDIDDFSKAILGKVEELKATVTSMRRQQSAAMAMAKPAAPKETEASAVRPKKKTSQKQQPPVEEKSEEELTLETWGQLKSKIGEILQKFSSLTNLEILRKILFEEI